MTEAQRQNAIKWLRSLSKEYQVDSPYFSGMFQNDCRDLANLLEEEVPVWECKAGGFKPLSQRLYDTQPHNIKKWYTRARQPLTRAEIDKIMQESGWQNSALRQADLEYVEQVVRAVELTK